MNSTRYTDLLARLKNQAQALTIAGHGSYLQLLELLAIQNDFENLRQLQQLTKAEARLLEAGSGVEMLSCTPDNRSIHRVHLAGSIWSLQVAKWGPMLCLEDRPYADFGDECRTSDLGLFQVLVKANEMSELSKNYPKHGWVVTRYGQYRVHTAEFFSDEEAKALSYQFGIPFASRSFPPYRQQERSEIFFLKSPAFASLRMAIRCGTIPLPPMTSWNYGLCSIWPHLVAMSDRDFKEVERILIWCFKRPQNVTLPHDALFKQWSQIPDMGSSGKGVSGGLGEIFRRQEAVRKALARDVKRVRDIWRHQTPT